MVASRFRAAAPWPDPSPPAFAGPADAGSLSDCNRPAAGGDHEVPAVIADFSPPAASGTGEPLDSSREGISALMAAGKAGPRRLAAGTSFILHIAVAGLLITGPNEVRIAGGRTTELAVVDVILAPAPVVETVAPEREAEPETVEEPAPIDPAKMINEATDLAALPEITPPEPIEAPQPAARNAPERIETFDPRPDLLAVPAEPDSAKEADTVPEPAEKRQDPKPAAESEPKQPAEAPEAEAEPLPPEEVQPKPTPQADNAPELATVPVPQPKPDYKPPEKTERAEAKPQPPRKAEKRPENPRSREPKEARPPARQVASGVGQRRSDAGNARVSNYPGRVVTKLRRALRYPAAARRDRLRGEVHVRFTVLASGAISGVSVIDSSGSPILDKAAVETVRRAAPFPDIPPAAGRSSWAFTVPLAFRP